LTLTKLLGLRRYPTEHYKMFCFFVLVDVNVASPNDGGVQMLAV